MDLTSYNVWKFISILAVLLFSMLIANVLKRKIGFLNRSLIPTSVLGGLLILVVSTVYQAITGEPMFEAVLFSGFDGGEYSGLVAPLSGSEVLEAITYHSLALGFIATSFKSSGKKLDKTRRREIFDSGVTTVSTYLLQAFFGLVFTVVVASFIMPEMFPAAGVILCFGFGQGTGQAFNYGNIFETASGEVLEGYQCGFAFQGGAQFGLAVAALGFLSACLGGVIYLNVLKRKGKIVLGKGDTSIAKVSDFQSENEIPVSESMDKLTVQIALVFLTYALTYLLLFGLGKLVPSLSSTVFGFNFLFGVLMATLVKSVLNFLTKKGAIQRQYVNDYLMNRLGGFLFDLMVVAGIAAINLYDLKDYWWILLLMCALGAVLTFFYNLFVAKTLFKDYYAEQFLVMYGMLTGTASTGVILLREADPDFKTCASDNLVYQQFIAIVFGFPMMIVATIAPQNPPLTILVAFLYFAVLNLILFRNKIFKRKSKQQPTAE